MGIREKELERMIKYAEGLGIKVSFIPSSEDGTEAQWEMSGKEIKIFTKKNQTKLSIILSLLHELGHHLDFVYNKRRHTKKVWDAVHAENPTKSQRRIIYEDELGGAAYHEIIYNELNLKIPLWKVRVERDLSLEIYKREIENPDGVSNREAKNIEKKLIERYKNKEK
jgi:hypothetical protein